MKSTESVIWTASNWTERAGGGGDACMRYAEIAAKQVTWDGGGADYSSALWYIG
ncbi:unnamed protein product, partial [Ectocarpus sp. 8 AP-2014]